MSSCHHTNVFLAEKNKADFAVILVGHDHRQEDFDEYTKHKTAFYRIPWSDRSKRDQISSAFSIYALPTLQIVRLRLSKFQFSPWFFPM